MRLLLLFLCAELVLPFYGARADVLNVKTPSEIPGLATNGPEAKFVPLSPGPNDGRIAFTAAQMLEQFHYLHLPFDSEISGKFLDLYINTYDPQHIHFLQSDIAEFEQYRHSLNVLTKQKRDTSPAYLIYNRFMQRLAERSVYARELLEDETFDFNSQERISLNRKTAPFPKDMDEARQLWRERLRYEYLEEKLNRETPTELQHLVVSRHTPVALALMGNDFHRDIVKFVETRYNRIFRNFREWESDKVLETYLTALARVYDPHSDYEDKDTLENFSIQMSLSLFGIGALLGTDDDGYCKIQSLTTGAPAEKSKKIKPNDRIVAVAQGTNEPVDVVQMPLNKVVDLIRGPKGTTVNLTIIPADAADTSTRVTVSVVRDEIKLEDQQAKAKIVERAEADGHTERLGVIDLPSFYASFTVLGGGHHEMKSATVDVARLLDKMEAEHVDGVILDLRHNGGGSLPEAIDLTGLFIKEGPVVQVRGSDKGGRSQVQVYEDRDPHVQYDGPLVVLTSRFSASASEIVAGALQDYGRALVVGGASTHGKGTVQSMSQLAPYLYMNGEFITTGNAASLGALKYTTNKFYRVTGSSTQLKGVVPDIILPSTYDYMETEEASEENALKWDEIRTTEFEKLNRVQPYLSELEKRSAARLAKSKDFNYVQEDIDLVKKAMADKTVSLNEKQRLQESAEADARRKAREAELKTRKASVEKIYDLTLKNGEVVMKEEPKPGTNDLAAGIVMTNSNHLNTVTFTNGNNGQLTVTNIASGTNALAAGEEAAAKPAPENPSPEEKAPLEEAEHILDDYISLLHANGTLTAEHLQRN